MPLCKTEKNNRIHRRPFDSQGLLICAPQIKLPRPYPSNRSFGLSLKAVHVTRNIEPILKPTVNEEKTQTSRIPTITFDFLSYTIGKCYWPQSGLYIETRPSKAKIERICREVRTLTRPNWSWLDEKEQLGCLDRMRAGWTNYFCLGPLTRVYHRVTHHAITRLRR